MFGPTFKAAAVALTAAAGFAVSTATPAVAEHDEFTKTGTVEVGNPRHSSALYYGVPIGGPRVTRALAPCDPTSDYNAVDGYWVDIAGFGGHRATLTMDPDAQFDITFFTETCRWTGVPKPWPGPIVAPWGLGEAVTVTVPEDARYAIVDLYYGADATFTLTIGHRHPVGGCGGSHRVVPVLSLAQEAAAYDPMGRHDRAAARLRAAGGTRQGGSGAASIDGS